MTSDISTATAGLIFHDRRELDIAGIGDRVCHAFEALEQTIKAVRVLADDQVRVSSAHHHVFVKVCTDHPVDGLPAPAPLFLEVSIHGADTRNGAVPHRHSVLAHALKSLHWTLSADLVKWVTPGSVLSSADFVMATSQPAKPDKQARRKAEIAQDQPGVIERRYTLPAIEETGEELYERLSERVALAIEAQKRSALFSAMWAEPDTRDQDEDVREETAPLRLSVWMVSFTVALFALPVGAALLVFNLLKGENLRLSAQAAALSGTFIALDTYGATAQTLAVIQGLGS